MELPDSLLIARPSKTKKIPLQKKFFIFPEMNFLALILKNSYIFSKESVSYISKNETLHFLVSTLKIFPSENFFYFFLKKTCSENISYIFSKESISYIFRNGTLLFFAKAWKIKEVHPRKQKSLPPPKKKIMFFQKKAFLIFNLFHQNFLHEEKRLCRQQ